jgi:hypothetical protein
MVALKASLLSATKMLSRRSIRSKTLLGALLLLFVANLSRHLTG